MRLTAKWIVPVSGPPIQNGTVVVEKDRIVFVGPSDSLPSKQAPGPLIDLKDSILFPGLVNAHAHLEFSDSPVKEVSGISFTRWVREIGSLPPNHSNLPLEKLMQGGATTVADHADPLSPSIETPLRRIIFWEVLGAERERGRQSFLQACLRAEREGGFVSPHSLYAVNTELLEELFQAEISSIHLLESEDEESFFRRQEGPLAIYVREKGGDLSFPLSSPIKWLAAMRRLSNQVLLVHANYINDDEISLLQQSGAGIVHCPGSHLFFGHRRFPLGELRKRGVRVGLGTDSLASNKDLSMLREMRLLREGGSVDSASLSPEEILKMATIESARLLKREGEIGTLEAGKLADIAAVRMKNRSGDPFEALFRAEAVDYLMIGGKEIKRPS